MRCVEGREWEGERAVTVPHTYLKYDGLYCWLLMNHEPPPRLLLVGRCKQVPQVQTFRVDAMYLATLEV